VTLVARGGRVVEENLVSSGLDDQRGQSGQSANIGLIEAKSGVLADV